MRLFGITWGAWTVVCECIRVRPQAPPRLTRLALEANKVVSVTDIRGVRGRLRIALPHQLGVDEPAADVDIREESSEAVPGLYIDDELHPSGFHQSSVGFTCGIIVWFSAFRRVVNLRSIDSDVPDLLDLIADGDRNRVTIDDARDVAQQGVWLLRCRLPANRHPKGGEGRGGGGVARLFWRVASSVDVAASKIEHRAHDVKGHWDFVLPIR